MAIKKSIELDVSGITGEYLKVPQIAVKEVIEIVDNLPVKKYMLMVFVDVYKNKLKRDANAPRVGVVVKEYDLNDNLIKLAYQKLKADSDIGGEDI